MQLLPHSLTAVRCFNAAAKHLSCSRAAEELFLSQGAVSKHLQTLEEHLGVKLFRRVHQGLVLTSAGTVYWEAVKPALSLLEEATARARMLDLDQSSTLYLRVPNTFGEKWLVPRLPDFNRRHPEITVQFAPRFAAAAGQAPFSAEIRGGRGMWDGMRAHYLTGREMVQVCSATLASRMQEKKPAELLNFRLLEHVHLPQLWERWFASQGVAGYDARRTQQYEQFSMMISALRASLGVACVPRCLIEDELQDGSLVQLFDSPLATDYGYYLAYPKERYRSVALKRFADWLADKCAEFEAS